MNIRRYLAQVGPNLCASDNGSEFINHHLLDWCNRQQITFTRSRPGNSNDGAHVEQKNWAVVRTIVGYLRYDTSAELLLLNQTWVLQSQLTNYFYPQQKLVSKERDGAKVTKKVRHRHHSASACRPARGRHRRGQGHPRRHVLHHQPAAVQRQIQALTTELIALATAKNTPTRRAPLTRALLDESTNQTSRAS